MSENRKVALAAGAVALCALALGFFVGKTRLDEPLTDMETLLAEAAVTDLQGRAVKLSDWRGKPLILNFWATWCAPCREEMPLLSRFQTAHAGQIQIVGLAIDEAKNVAKFRERVEIVFPIVLGDASTLDLMRKMGNSSGALPFSLLLDARGRVVDRHLGPLTEADLERLWSKRQGDAPSAM